MSETGEEWLVRIRKHIAKEVISEANEREARQLHFLFCTAYNEVSAKFGMRPVQSLAAWEGLDPIDRAANRTYAR